MLLHKIQTQIFTLVMLLTPLFSYAASENTPLTATIIGSGSPIYNEKRASASVLISNGNTQLLVDMGNGTQANLAKLGIDTRTLSGLLFTHHHLDHNEEFVPIFIRSLLGRQHFSIIGPPNTVKLTQQNLDLYSDDIAYRLGKTNRQLSYREKAFDVKELQGGESFTINNIRISTIQVPHSIHTIAYRFDYQGQSIVVTGDLTYSKNLVTLAKDADIMIIDSGGMVMENGKKNKRRNKQKAQQENKQALSSRERNERQGKNNHTPRIRAHLNLAESSLLAKQANVNTLVYTHFVSGIVDKEASLKIIRKQYSGKVIFGKDLMLIDTPDKHNP
ncbi:MBL fold metallo-hydrolase [Shewanella surugensis]|uniref:MBL fold metallo-hydrolase n=1 Tax=Shewanella surugensis TaxID=212020 RepID=A0ABT0LH48_9GAMM|nr:MBL fold metallo-hydrolase [Shewanella surugensis]MCL1127031.1 MBL fold metallo-hydrolase [Shewanella surugensis]